MQLTQKETHDLLDLQVVMAPYGFSLHPDGLDGCQLRWFSGQWAADSAMPWNSMASLGVLELARVGGRSSRIFLTQCSVITIPLASHIQILSCCA